MFTERRFDRYLAKVKRCARNERSGISRHGDEDVHFFRHFKSLDTKGIDAWLGVKDRLELLEPHPRLHTRSLVRWRAKLDVECQAIVAGVGWESAIAILMRISRQLIAP